MGAMAAALRRASREDDRMTIDHHDQPSHDRPSEDQPGEDPVGDSPTDSSTARQPRTIDRAAMRNNHDLSNLLLAARLRLDALRAAVDTNERTAHLDALDSCLEKATQILKDA